MTTEERHGLIQQMADLVSAYALSQHGRIGDAGVMTVLTLAIAELGKELNLDDQMIMRGLSASLALKSRPGRREAIQ